MTNLYNPLTKIKPIGSRFSNVILRFGILMFALMPVTHAASLSGKITLELVVANVLEHNPQLRMDGYEADAAAARIRQAGQDRPLEVTLDMQDFAGSGTYNGINRLESTLSLAKVLELGGKASSRENLARRHASLLNNMQDSKRMDILAIAAEQFMHVVVDQHRLDIAREQLKLVKRTHDIVAHRVKAGRSHVAERRRVNIALARSEIKLEHAKHELSSSRLKLATAWGETRPQFDSAMAELFVLPAVQPFEQLEMLLANNPDLARFATEERVAQARLHLAQARQTPDLKLSGGIRYFNEQKDGALVLSVSMPFGSASRAKPYVEEMQYLEQREPLRYEQQRLTLHSSLYAIYQELLHAQSAFEALNSKMIPEAERAANDYEQGYKSGRFSLLELNETQRILLDARLEAVLTAANYHRFRIEIERLTGAAMRSGVNP
jgi:cobalt-zinc-cadmium efflux system outer membrane protein